MYLPPASKPEDHTHTELVNPSRTLTNGHMPELNIYSQHPKRSARFHSGKGGNITNQCAEGSRNSLASLLLRKLLKYQSQDNKWNLQGTTYSSEESYEGSFSKSYSRSQFELIPAALAILYRSYPPPISTDHASISSSVGDEVPPGLEYVPMEEIVANSNLQQDASHCPELNSITLPTRAKKCRESPPLLDLAPQAKRRKSGTR